MDLKIILATLYIEKEINSRIAQASAAFQKLRKIWNSRVSVGTKLKLYNVQVKCSFDWP